MINITFHYDDEFRRKGFTIKGHANYAPSGQDIVCAAVTSNAIAVNNSLELLAKVKWQSEISRDGMTECIIKDEFLNEKTDLLLEHFEMAMDRIKREYPKNIKILKK